MRSSSPRRGVMHPSRKSLCWHALSSSKNWDCISASMMLEGSASPPALVVVLKSPVLLFHMLMWFRCVKARDYQLCEKAESCLIPQALKTLPEQLGALSSPPSKTRTAAPHVPSSYMCLPKLHTTQAEQAGNNTTMREHSIFTEHSPSTWSNTNHNMQSNHSQPQGCVSNNICFCRSTSRNYLPAEFGLSAIPCSTHGNKIYQAA